MLTAEMSGRAASPVLVGRDEQMAALEDAFASVRQGGPTAVLLGGEAGVGKSRLVSEFGQAAEAAGACVLTGGCLELGTDGLPFAPFTAVLRDLVHELGADAVASMLPGRTTRGLARLLPELRRAGQPARPTPARRGPACSRRCSARWITWPGTRRWCWSSRTRTGPTGPAGTC